MVGFLSSVLLLMTKSHHNIVKVLWIHEHEPQASESTRRFDNIMTWRQFAFYYNKNLEKGSVKHILLFKKKLQ